MFIYSIRASGIKFFAVIVLALAMLIGIITVSSAEDALLVSGEGSIRYDGIKSVSDVTDFLMQFGIEVDAQSAKSEEITLQGDFDRVMLSYNEIQKKQGLDLSKYKNKKTTHYTLRVTNFNENTEESKEDEYVFANVFVFRDRVVGGDVSRGGDNGFVITFSEFKR